MTSPGMSVRRGRRVGRGGNCRWPGRRRSLGGADRRGGRGRTGSSRGRSSSGAVRATGPTCLCGAGGRGVEGGDGSCRKEIGDAGDDADDGEEEYDHADHPVDEIHRAEIEVSPDFVDEVGDAPPPGDCPGEDKDESEDIMVEPDVGHQEVEAGEEADAQEYDQGIGECEEKAGEDVLLGVGFLAHGFLDFCGGIFLEEIYGESDKHGAADELDDVLVALEEFLYEREAEAGQQAVEEVGDCRAHAGVEACAAPLVEGALYAEDPHGAHGGRDEDSDGDSTPDHIKKTFDEVHHIND